MRKKLLWLKLITMLLPIFILIIPTSTKAPNHPLTYLDSRFNTYFHEIAIPERNKKAITKIMLEKDKNLDKFISFLGFYESRNNWKIVNTLGYLGEWQFGYAARKQVGYGHITKSKFKRNPWIWPREHQEIALKRYLIQNQKTLIRLNIYYQYLHSTIKGIYITKSGLLAASHLGGAGNVIIFLNTKGENDFADANGTKISDYLQKFNNYKF